MSPAANLPVVGVLPSEINSGGNRTFWRDVFFVNLPLPFQKLRTYLWVIVFSRMLGPSEFGIWSLFQTTMGIAMIMTSMTQGNAMMRFLGGGRSQEEINRVFSSVVAAVTVSALIVGLILAGTANSLASPLFHDRLGQRVIILIALILPFENWYEQMRGLLRAQAKPHMGMVHARRQMPEAILLLLLVLLWKTSVIRLIGGYLLSAILSVAAGLGYLFRYQGIRIVKPMASVWTSYLPYGLALVPAGLVSTISFLQTAILWATISIFDRSVSTVFVSPSPRWDSSSWDLSTTFCCLRLARFMIPEIGLNSIADSQPCRSLCLE